MQNTPLNNTLFMVKPEHRNIELGHTCETVATESLTRTTITTEEEGLKSVIGGCIASITSMRIWEISRAKNILLTA